MEKIAWVGDWRIASSQDCHNLGLYISRLVLDPRNGYRSYSLYMGGMGRCYGSTASMSGLERTTESRALTDLSNSRVNVVNKCGLADIDAAWMAAMIDGEGAIGAVETWRLAGRATKKKVPIIKVRLQLTNTNKRLVEAVVEKSRTGRLLGPYHTSNSRAKPYWKWQVVGQDALWLLEQIFPWLIAKTEQARVAISLQQLKQEMMPRRGFDSASDPRRSQVIVLRDELTSLNMKGCSK